MPLKGTRARKMKAAVLEEDEKLAARPEESSGAQPTPTVSDRTPASRRTAREGGERVLETIADLRTKVHGMINQLAEAMLREVERRRELHVEMQRQRQMLEEELAATRRSWEREQEERKYTAERERRRRQEDFEEKVAQRERELKERETLLTQQEADVAELRRSVEALPDMVEKQVQLREKEIRQRVQGEFDSKFRQAQQEWETARRVYELQLTTLHEQAKSLHAEVAAHKQESELAQRRTQELAVRVIEHGRMRLQADQDAPPP